MTPTKKTEEEAALEEQAALMQIFLDGKLDELYAWDRAVKEQELAALPEPDPICDRLMCSNTPNVVCTNCGAAYCEDHPPAEEPYNECDRCGWDLSPDNPYYDAYQREIEEMNKRAAAEEKDERRRIHRREKKLKAQAEERAERQRQEKERTEKLMEERQALLAEETEEDRKRRKAAREQRVADAKEMQERIKQQIAKEEAAKKAAEEEAARKAEEEPEEEDSE